jgi:hypothetical protein
VPPQALKQEARPAGAAVRGYPRKSYTRHQKPGNITYSDKIAEVICDRLATGESLSSICQDADMPTEKAVRVWLETRPETFLPKYTRAREIGYDKVAEQVIAIGDQDFTGPDGWVDNGAVQAARLASENRKWFLSKLMPKKYGDKVTQEITGQDGQQLVTRIELIPVEPRRQTSPEIDADGSPEEAQRQRLLKIPQKP